MEQNLWGMKLLSPVFKFRPGKLETNWVKEISTAWNVLQRSYRLSLNGDCATHISISPCGHRKWLLDDVKRITKTVLYFERAVDAIVPLDRRISVFCKSNKHREDVSLAWLFDLIDKAGSIQEVVWVMNGSPTDMKTWKNFRWNFCPLLNFGPGAIEFRQAPSSVGGVNSTAFWINFAVAFVQGALTLGNTLYGSKEEAIPKDLANLIKVGASQAGMSDASGTNLAKEIGQAEALEKVVGNRTWFTSLGKRGTALLSQKMREKKCDNYDEFEKSYLVV
ncbi:hypothetical protein M011DRAFT_155896 [Sporormia fimetaria CBS 119925]|uniref:Uncharacterized protein n=1 Tax=Sporormia fimetaria CBS 119925 TaxID=1340428 RepID=A0A6A6V6A3_9PLEO|nr:hypothetical protein M011DRAFT_155896 [Sporormia fimetaria CBS 119925]